MYKLDLTKLKRQEPTQLSQSQSFSPFYADIDIDTTSAFSPDTAARIVVHEEGESLPNTRRSRPGLNDDPTLCATLYTAGGVGELYQRRLTLSWYRYTVQTTTPSGLGTSENSW